MLRVIFSIYFLCTLSFASITLGVDHFFQDENYKSLLKNKRVGLVSNQTAVNQKCQTTLSILQNADFVQLTALFAPEHGFYGDAYAYEQIQDKKLASLPVYSLHGMTRRPTTKMLEGIDVLIFDIQDIGSRSYTYISTLFYCMEEAVKQGIPVIVFDRPNPMGGEIVDGFLLEEEELRSFIGYINVPYCHGMTIGELASLFNEEYKIGCDLTIVPMRGYKRSMLFKDTGLIWVPTSPQIPEDDTPFYYPTTGIIGHLSLVSIGVGYTLPFKLIGAPWIDADRLAQRLQEQNLPGVFFQPYYYRPFFGKFKQQNCEGVRIVITDPAHFLPVTTQYTILGVLKQLYPKEFAHALTNLEGSKNHKELFDKFNGNRDCLRIIKEEPYFIWKLRTKCKESREKFLESRKKYLLYK